MDDSRNKLMNGTADIDGVFDDSQVIEMIP